MYVKYTYLYFIYIFVKTCNSYTEVLKFADEVESDVTDDIIWPVLYEFSRGSL